MKAIFWLIEFLWVHPTRILYYKRLFKYHIHLDYPCAEFGVYKGKTLSWIRKLSGKVVFTFDSCEGLPGDWGKYRKGDFAYRFNVDYKGWFRDTIPSFNRDYDLPLSFINIDCDLYESTVDVLEGISSKIVPGTIISFDEYSKGENKAFMEWLRVQNKKAIMVDKANHLQAAFKIL